MVSAPENAIRAGFLKKMKVSRTKSLLLDIKSCKVKWCSGSILTPIANPIGSPQVPQPDRCFDGVTSKTATVGVVKSRKRNPHMFCDKTRFAGYPDPAD